MKFASSVSIKDYDYFLPEDCIAKYPLPQRDASRLLIYREGKISEDIYKHISRHLPANALLLFNDTKVIEARLFFQKPSGGIIEIFCLEPHRMYRSIADAMAQKNQVLWNCLIGGASKWKRGQILEKQILSETKKILLQAHYAEKLTDTFTIRFTWDDMNLSFAGLLHLTGAVPLPPYINRKAETTDNERYQTIYAREDGSVAAPTAGLHFTENIFDSLNKKNIRKDFVTLHVGAGTFKPVTRESVSDHDMHAEYLQVTAKTIQHILQNLNGTIIPVGTTSLRTVESLYWLGVKIIRQPAISEDDLLLSQWEAYNLEKENIQASDALEALLSWLNKNKRETLFSKTQLLIMPGYTPKIAHALITNFHQPKSTLLLLVAALTGEDWKKIYGYALKEKFRFLSYGDGSLLWIRK